GTWRLMPQPASATSPSAVYRPIMKSRASTIDGLPAVRTRLSAISSAMAHRRWRTTWEVIRATRSATAASTGGLVAIAGPPGLDDEARVLVDRAPVAGREQDGRRGRLDDGGAVDLVAGPQAG